MAVIHKPLEEKDLKHVTALKMKEKYLELAETTNSLLNGEVMICPRCGSVLSISSFYRDERYALRVFPICKECLANIASNSEGKKKGKESIESIKKTLRLMDRPFKVDIYTRAYESCKEQNQGKRLFNVFTTYMNMLVLASFGDLTYDDSDGDEDKISSGSTVSEEIKQRFGKGYSDDDYLFLQKEYEDWCTRYECSTKAQEELFQSLAFNKLEKNKARLAGKPSKDLETTMNNLLTSANLTPRQNKADAFMEAQTFGTLIQKWEETEPLPELDEELMDVESIGIVTDIIVTHAARTAGVDIKQSKNYQDFMEKHTVRRREYSEDSEADDIFDRLFGKDYDV